MRSQAKASSARSIEGHAAGRRIGSTSAFCLALFTLLISGLFASAVAPAATVYRPTGGVFANKLGEPLFSTKQREAVVGQAAVDEATGSILLVRGFDNALNSGGKVNVLTPEGDSATLQSSFGEGELSRPFGLALDQSSRAVYVADTAYGQIFKYDISGSGPLVFTLDPNFTSPPRGAGSGELGYNQDPLAVDPTNGDLLVGDSSNHRVSRFAPNGSFISSFDGSDSRAGTFHVISSIAVDGSGSIYVVDITSGFSLDAEYEQSVLERFDSGGLADNSFAPTVPTPRTVAVDLGSGNVIVAGRSNYRLQHQDGTGPYPVRLYVLNGDRVIDEQDMASDDLGSVVSGIAMGEANKRLYVAAAKKPGPHPEFELPEVEVLDALPAPDVIATEPTGVSSFGAHVSGAVDTLSRATSYHFEYSREGGPAKSTEVISITKAEAEAQTGPQPVSADLTGLIANSEYTVRLVGTDTESGASVTTQPRHFVTSVAAPEAVTGDAYDLTQTSATLAGKVNPYGQQTTYRFEYGTTTAYGMRTPADHDEAAGNGREPLVAAGYLHGLQPGTEYHYRFVAVNGSGTTAGGDRTFTTKSLAAPPRVYEQVSPVEKGGANVNGLIEMNVSPDGSHVMYQWKSAPLGDGSSPLDPRTAGVRGPSGWSFLGLDPPQLAGSSAAVGGVGIWFVVGVSEDGTKAAVISLKKLAPGAIEGGSNLYLRDTSTGEYTTIAATPGTSLWGQASGPQDAVIVDGTPDYSRLLLEGIEFDGPLIPGAPEQALYEWSEGQLHLASIAPDGTPLEANAMGGGSGIVQRDHNWISDDGSQYFFEAQPSETNIRYNDETTVKVGGHFCGATPDGRYGFVVGRDLTADSEPGVPSLYRFDTVTRESELLVSGAEEDQLSCMQVSRSGKSVFFVSKYALVPGAAEGAAHLYVWHDDQVRLIATMGVPGEFMASDNGRYFVFRSYDRLTGYDNSNNACVVGHTCAEIFRYDVDTDQLTCASCRRDGGRATGDARIGTSQVEGNFRFQRSVLDDGTVIFDTTDSLSALDTNSNRDVYTYDGTEQTLISSGFENSRAEIDGTSADGRDIFFTTQAQLVGQDTDSLADIYDARVEGGIPGQNPPPPRPECIRDDCKATPNQGPELPFGGSESLSGPGNVQATPARKRCGKGTHARKAKGKTRCVKQAKKQHKKQAKSNRRQGR